MKHDRFDCCMDWINCVVSEKCVRTREMHESCTLGRRLFKRDGTVDPEVKLWQEDVERIRRGERTPPAASGQPNRPMTKKEKQAAYHRARYQRLKAARNKP